MKNGKKNIKTSEKAIKKIDKQVPAASKKEESIIELIAAKFETNEEALIASTGFEKDGSEFVLCSVLQTLCQYEDNPKQTKKDIKRFLSAMGELKPRDGFEGMLIGQMVVTFNQAMNYIQKSNMKGNRESTSIHDAILNRSVKLMRLYNQQLEALDKHRRNGKQKMTVEHVHVHKGGQAIVGNVNQRENE